MARFKYDEIPDDTGPGLYRFFLMEGATLPGISVDETRLLYVGTTKSKRDRNHFYPDAAKSTLRRTIAAILKNAGKLQVKAYSRGSGSDTAKDAAHSRFTLEVESRLTDWMKNNLEFSFDIFEGTDDEREVKETTAMAKEHPPLNLNKWDNPIGKSLRNLRAICAEEARQNGPIPRSENENVPILLVLASASPRRRELLTQAGFTFQVHPAHIPEDPHSNEDPIAYVVRLAREKAQAVYDKLADQAATVLGADTTVVLDNQILGKPADAADAARMLRPHTPRHHWRCRSYRRAHRSCRRGDRCEIPRAFGRRDSRLYRYWRTYGQGGRIRYTGPRGTLDSTHRRRLLQCCWIAVGVGYNATGEFLVRRDKTQQI